MSATILSLQRPLVQRLIDLARQYFGRTPEASSLYGLDARALADIGVDASEIGSIESESRGRIDATRLRIVVATQHV